MKITANRRDDILRRKNEWEEDYNRRKSSHEMEVQNYREAQRQVGLPVQKFFEDMFAKYNLLDAVVRVDPGRWEENSLGVHIEVNEDNKFAESVDVALAWRYDAYMKQGEVVRESSSWSGMQAVTADQLANLEQSLNALKELASLDWVDLLDRKLPEWDTYVTTRNPSRSSRPNFEQELMEAELEDIIGERKMIKVHPFDSSWYNGYVYVAIVKDSGSQYTIKEIPEYYVQRGEASKYFDKTDLHRVKKIKIKPVQPLEIIEV